MDKLLNIVKESLAAVNHPRFYETERGFQGAFLSELNQRLPFLQWDGAIVEQEYQKRMPHHGLKIRPDIIIHVPFDEGQHDSRKEGNFIVFELKLNAGEKEALPDFENLSNMCEILGYPLGIFINIGSRNTFLNRYQGPLKEKLHAFAVNLNGEQVEINEDTA